MAIGINDYSIYLKSYRVPEIPYVGAAGAPAKEAQQPLAQQEAVQAPQNAQQSYERPALREPALEDVSLTFNRGDDFGYIGKDSSLSLLDLDTRMPEPQKDQILQQYQFFAGSSDGTLVNNADGIVSVKAN